MAADDVLSALAFVFITCWLTTLIGLAVTLTNLVPDYRERNPPKRLTNALFRRDLLNDVGRVWAKVTMCAYVLGVFAGIAMWFIVSRRHT